MKNSVLKLILLAYLLICNFLIWGQPKQYQFRRIGTESGLSNSNVSCILQDSRGFIWFGTFNGLNKYDGKRITQYNVSVTNKSSLSNKDILDLTEDSNGNLWIATAGGGLNKYHRNSDDFTSFTRNVKQNFTLPGNNINCLQIANKQKLWLGTENGLGLMDLQTEKFEQLPDTLLKYGLHNKIITAIFLDSKGNLLFGTEGSGLFSYNPKTKNLQVFKVSTTDKNSISSNNIKAIAEDKDHNYWIGTISTGLNKYNTQSGRWTNFKEITFTNAIFDLEWENDNNLWIGVENGGIINLNIKTLAYQRFIPDEIDHNSLSNISINCIYKDFQNNLWVGTFAGGVNFYNKQITNINHFSKNATANSISSNIIQCFHQDKDSTIWIGTEGEGLNSFDPKTGKFKHFQDKTGKTVKSQFILSITEDNYDQLWMATWGDGVTIFDKKKEQFRQLTNNPKDTNTISSNFVYSTSIDSHGDIWIASWGGGLDQYNPKTGIIKHIPLISSNNASTFSNKPTFVTVASDDNVWVATYDKGAYMLNARTGKITNFNNSQSNNRILSNNVSHIHEDPTGEIWISTSMGTCSYSPATQTISNYPKLNSIKEPSILAVTSDDQGNIWLTKSHKIVTFNKLKNERKVFNFKSNQLQNEFREKALFLSNDNQLYLGGNNGFHIYDINQKSVIPNNEHIPLHITKFLLFNSEVSISTPKNPTPLPANINSVCLFLGRF